MHFKTVCSCCFKIIGQCRCPRKDKETHYSICKECEKKENEEKTMNETTNQKSDLKVGDVVTLKSGGAQMTIANIEGEEAHCQWFQYQRDFSLGFGGAGGQALTGNKFNVAMLKKVEDEYNNHS